MNIQQLKELKISDIAEAMESCAEGYAALVCDSLEFSLEREMAESEHQTIFSAIEAALNSSERLEAAERANSAQSDHINQQQDRIDSLEQKNAALGKALGTAERERDELRASLIAASNMQSIHREACQKAESELARRDKEAGEPVAHSWINGLVIPESAMTASYDPGAGTVICAVAEVDESLQSQGYPVLCWAYLDVVPGMMIDRATNSNITSHVVRWLPVARKINE